MGKSTAAEVIVENMGGVHINKKNYCLFDYIAANYNTHGEPKKYFLQNFLKSPEIFLDLLNDARPYIENRIYNEIQKNCETNPPPALVVDFVGVSGLYPWIGEPKTTKILITTPETKRKKLLLEREPLMTEQACENLFKGQMKQINPDNANLILVNDYTTKQGFKQHVKDVIIDGVFYKS